VRRGSLLLGGHVDMDGIELDLNRIELIVMGRRKSGGGEYTVRALDIIPLVLLVFGFVDVDVDATK
jgi:hypothetical protein